MMMFGPIHTEAYAFNSHDGRVDFYVRAALAVPPMTYHQYKLGVMDNSEFWKARGYDYLGPVDKPEWADGQISWTIPPASRL